MKNSLLYITSILLSVAWLVAMFLQNVSN